MTLLVNQGELKIRGGEGAEVKMVLFVRGEWNRVGLSWERDGGGYFVA